MKKALLTALLLVPFFSLAQEEKIYLKVQSPLDPTYTSGCQAYPTIAEHQQMLNEQASQQPTDPNISYGSWEYQYTTTIYENATSCGYRYHFKRSYSRFGTERDPQWTSAESHGTFEQVPNCPPQPRNENDTEYQKHFIMWEHPSRSWLCYSPEKLAEVDSCGDTTDSIDNMLVSNESGVSCMAKEDGSVCPVTSDGSITLNSTGQEVFFYKLDETKESDSCYYPQEKDGNHSDVPDIPDEPGECSDFNGLGLCYENPLNVCNSAGTCPTGCGVLSANGQTGFVCVSKDTDGDGLPDYMDPDIDGDGIKNEDDLDKDGDGKDDPINPNQGGQDLGKIEALLSKIERNTSKQSNAPTAQEIGEEVGKKTAEKLTELRDFSSATYEQSLDQKNQKLQEDTEKFLDNTENNLQKAFQESDYQQSYNALKGVLSPTACTATFSIPLSKQSLDLCDSVSKAKPFLYVIFAIATFIYCIRRISQTARSE